MAEKKSLSKYIYYNCKDIVFQDENGNVINGVKLDSEEYEKGNSVILRFKDGYLDGDSTDEKGNLKTQLPAVEGENHQEYWRHNKLHRDNGLPAVISGKPPKYEWWIDGIKQNNPHQN